MQTASTPLASSAARSSPRLVTLKSVAKAFALAALQLTTAKARPPADARSPKTNLRATNPVPIMPQLNSVKTPE